MAGFPAKDSHGAAGVHPYKPVGLRAGTGGVPEVGVIPVVLQRCQSLLDRQGIEGGKPDTLDRAGVMKVFEDFIDKKLAFPIRVSGVDDHFRFAEQMVDHLELSEGAFFGT